MSRLLLTLLTGLALISTTRVYAATIKYSGGFGPLNGSGVTGTVSISLTDNVLSVQVDAGGFEPFTVHRIGIDGRLDAMGNPLPPLGPKDLDKDGFIEMPEAAQFIGNTLLALDSPQNTGQYPTATAAGTIALSQSYKLSPALLDMLTPLDFRTVEIDGMTVWTVGSGTVNEGSGLPEFNADLPVATASLAQAPEPPGIALILAGLALIWTKRLRTRH